MRVPVCLAVFGLAALSGCFTPADPEDGANDVGGPGNDDGETVPEGVTYADEGRWAQGDRWSYSTAIAIEGAEPITVSHTLTVEGEERHEGFEAYRVRSSKGDGSTVYYTQDDLNPIQGEHEVPYYSFPLWVGKAWNVTRADPTQPGVAKVEAHEEKGSTAGVFLSWRIKLTYESGAIEYYWFADGVANEIRHEVRSDDFTTVIDLQSYHREDGA